MSLGPFCKNVWQCIIQSGSKNILRTRDLITLQRTSKALKEVVNNTWKALFKQKHCYANIKYLEGLEANIKPKGLQFTLYNVLYHTPYIPPLNNVQATMYSYNGWYQLIVSTDMFFLFTVIKCFHELKLNIHEIGVQSVWCVGLTERDFDLALLNVYGLLICEHNCKLSETFLDTQWHLFPIQRNWF
jgi:hypothetical protein